MTEPSRWSDPDSEVDPVVRQLLRYAQDQGPTLAQSRGVLRKFHNALEPLKPRRLAQSPLSRLRRRLGSVGIILGIGGAFATAALAGYQLTSLVAAHRSIASTAHPTKRLPHPERVAQVSPAPVSEHPVIQQLEPSPPASAEKPVLKAQQGTQVSVAVLPPTVALTDVELLAETRKLITANPSQALARMREHAMRFPSSALSEERDALRIEALFRLGRTTLALQALGDFEKHYPVSLYRRRLHSLGSP